MSMKTFIPGERLFAADINGNFDETKKGENITSGTVAAARIANLDASKITSGAFNTARIPNLDASKITSGTFNTARIPNLAASKITSGTFNEARLPAGYRVRSGRLGVTSVTSGNVVTTTVTFPAGSFSSTPRVITVREFGTTLATEQRDVQFSFGSASSTGFTYFRGNAGPGTQGLAGPWLAVG